MERARTVKFETNLSFSRHQTLSYFMGEKFDERGEIELFENPQLPTRCCPLKASKSPNEAMEFLSRTWTPSSSDFFQILSLNGREPEQEFEEQQTEERGIVHSDRDEKIKLEQALTLLSTGNLVQSAAGKHKQLHTSWKNLAQIKVWLGGELFSSLSKRCRTRRKEKLRLHVAQVHAALSVTRLAAAIAGIMANSRIEPINPIAMGVEDSVGELDQKLASVVASSAALVATVCAEAAETVGADRDSVASAIATGLLTKSSADIVALTATAATCLRGAATLELRAASRHALDNQKILARGALLPVRMPEGKVRVRLVSIFLWHNKLTVRIAKRYLHGVINRYKEYRIFQATEEDLKKGGGGGGGKSRDSHGFCSLTLGTTGGAMQVMFEDQTLCSIWSSTIFRLLCD